MPRHHDLQPLEDAYQFATLKGDLLSAKALQAGLQNIRNEIRAGHRIVLEYKAKPMGNENAPVEPLPMQILETEEEFERWVRVRFPSIVEWPEDRDQ